MIKFKTNKLFNFVGLQRCGCHTICYHLLHQYKKIDKPHQLQDFSNNVWGFLVENREYIMLNYRFFYENKLNYNTKNNIKYGIIVYEISNLEDFNIDFEDKLDIFGNIQHEYNIILLRDFLNFSASWYKKEDHIPQHVIAHWKSRAKEIIGETHYIPNKIIILYNKWVTDRQYRKNICQQLGLDFTDIGKNYVPFFGNGSSFDQLKYDGKAQEMDVNNRWRNFIHDWYFRSMMEKHRDLVELSNYIFKDKS